MFARLSHAFSSTSCHSASPYPTVLLDVEAYGETGKWFKLWSKLTTFGSFIMLLSLFCSIAFLEFQIQRKGQWTASIQQESVRSIEKALHHAPHEKLCQNDQNQEGTALTSIPKGIVQETTDLQFRSLGGDPIAEERQISRFQSLLTIPVGFKQKESVNKIIKKFTPENFTVMLFHYDDIVDEWKMFPWNDRVIHIAAANQTKWWFAKRFLHPDIVAAYKYIFLWDEDIGVDNFDPVRYLSIVEEEGLEISQPALDSKLSGIHHQITGRQPKWKVHRRIYRSKGSLHCFENSTQPPCTGWVEMMVPVFSASSWRCAWYMIQNDLVHAWGMDMKLGYCVQGDRTQKVGVVNEQYVVHYGIPSLGGQSEKVSNANVSSVGLKWGKGGEKNGARAAVRRRSNKEFQIFQRRWAAAVQEDGCWTDPYH